MTSNVTSNYHHKLICYLETIQAKEKEATLDSLQVEQERGITVKAHTTSMFYKMNNETYMLNLIDTPVS